MAVSFNLPLPKIPSPWSLAGGIWLLMQKNSSRGPPHTSSDPVMPREAGVLPGMQIHLPTCSYDRPIQLASPAKSSRPGLWLQTPPQGVLSF